MSIINDLRSILNRLGNIPDINTIEYVGETRNKTVDENLVMIEVGIKDYVTFSVGGKEYSCSRLSLKEIKGSIFEILFADDRSEDWNDKIIFFDRDYCHFDFIFNYIKYKKLDFKDMFNLEELKTEAEFYGLAEITDVICSILYKVNYISVECSFKLPESTQNLEDLVKHDTTKGIYVTGSPAFIIFELSHSIEFSKIEIAGCKQPSKRSTNWLSSNGALTKIYTSILKCDWVEVGIIPENYSDHMISFNVQKSRAKYVKFERSNSSIGISHLKLIY